MARHPRLRAATASSRCAAKCRRVYDRQLVVAITRHVAGVFGIDDQLTVVELDPQRVRQVNRRSRSSRAAAIFLGSAPHRQPQRPTLPAPCIATLAVATLMLTGCGGGDASRVPVHPVTGAIQFRGQPTIWRVRVAASKGSASNSRRRARGPPSAPTASSHSPRTTARTAHRKATTCSPCSGTSRCGRATSWSAGRTCCRRSTRSRKTSDVKIVKSPPAKTTCKPIQIR